ncbi:MULTISPECIES: ferredoxin [Nocardia]|uniref:Ferredoxin n=1 Tax=Nocardia vinacea TaxID=96468 RepID=A0ABZ1YRB3_9NOCA|nr:ferredoxin [Nocardia vinacea]
MTEQFEIHLDTTRCRAYGVCVSVMPEVFETPPGSPVAVLKVHAVDASEEEDLDEAIRYCPAQALAKRPLESIS